MVKTHPKIKKAYIEGFKRGVKWALGYHYLLNSEIENIHLKKALKRLKGKEK